VSIDEQQHVALPTLYGAPAYARPPLRVPESERPFDPDELPIVADMTEDELEFASGLPAHAWAPGGAKLGGNTKSDSDDQRLRPRRFRLRRVAGRILHGS
jgi:hypothetical protein